MLKKQSELLNNRLESFLADLREATSSTVPKTGRLSRFRFSSPPPGWIWESDVDGKCLWCSHEVEQILGYRADELVGQELSSLALTSQSAEEFRRALATRKSVQNLKMEARDREGKPLSLLFNVLARETGPGKVTGFRGVAQVLETELPRRAPPLSHSIDASMTSVIEPRARTSWDAPYGFTDDGGQVTRTDERLEGYLETEPMIEGQRLTAPIRIQNLLLGVLEFDGTRDGRPWSDNDRALVEAVAEQLALALQDARTRELSEMALDDMREADQLKSQFLANMSHELRTPLNSIIGFSRVILKGIDGPVTDTQKQDLSAIYNAGQHLLGLINDILDLSKIDAGKMELAFSELDLAEIIRGVMSTAVGLVKDKPIKLVLNVPHDLPTIQVDSIRVRQVLLNLISNAAKFTDEGQIGVMAKIEEKRGRREVLISVSDTGPGIDPKDQEKLFEPFSQVDASPTRKTGGTGLGLSICRHLVELHGGKIWVESHPGRGSTFSFTLPTEPALSHAVEVGEEAPLILAVDDDPTVISRWKELFEADGYRFRSADDPFEVAALVEQLRPGMLLVDPLLTVRDPWQVLADVRRSPRASETPVMMCSLLKDQPKGFGLSGFDHLTKPVQEGPFRAALQRLPLREKAELDLLLIDSQLEDLRRLNSFATAQPRLRVRSAESGFEGLVSARQKAPDGIVLNLLMANAEGFRMMEALRVDERTRGVKVILMTPLEPSPEQHRQLRLWTEHLMRQATVAEQDLAAEVEIAVLRKPDSQSST